MLFTAAALTLYQATLFFDLIFVVVCIGLGFWSAKRAFRLKVTLPAAPHPEHPVVFWNPKSGGGKAAAVNLPRLRAFAESGRSNCHRAMISNS